LRKFQGKIFAIIMLCSDHEQNIYAAVFSPTIVMVKVDLNPKNQNGYRFGNRRTKIIFK
jgi:hypothetical protein